MKVNPDWAPCDDNALLLKDVLSFVNSLPYEVTLRFTFYNWYQTTSLKKTSYSNFKLLTSRARNTFWGGWRPDTFVDDTIVSIVRGVPAAPIPAKPDYITSQKYYVEIWFESAGMVRQFDYFTKDYHVTLVAFGGDATNYHKWIIAKRLENRFQNYRKPIKILYFGDCDDKGHIIPDSALHDIKRYCSIDFDFIHCGLTLEQAKHYDVMEKPDADIPQFQWEALSHKDAGNLILSSLTKYWNKPTGV